MLLFASCPAVSSEHRGESWNPSESVCVPELQHAPRCPFPLPRGMPVQAVAGYPCLIGSTRVLSGIRLGWRPPSGRHLIDLHCTPIRAWESGGVPTTAFCMIKPEWSALMHAGSIISVTFKETAVSVSL